MSPTEKGAFCQKCTTEVHDFTDKSNSEIRAVLLENAGEQICGRYSISQPESLNADFDAWKFNSQRSMQKAMIFSLVVVFGLTLFSCNNKQDAEALRNVQTSLNEIELAPEPEVIVVQQKVKQVETLNTIPPEDVVMLDREVQNLEECVIRVSADQIRFEDQREYYTMGVSVSSTRYIEHLEDLSRAEVDPLMEIELDENGLEFPMEFASKVYPNPAHEATSLEIKLPTKQEQIVINLFDMSGSHIQSVYEGELDRGTHTYQMNLIDLQPGIYLVTIMSGDFKETVRISKS